MAYSKFDHNPPIFVKMILTIIKGKNLDFYKSSVGQVTIDKNMYLPEAGGNRSTSSHPIQYHRPNACTDWLKFSFFPRTIVTWNGLTTETVSADETVSAKTVDRFTSKI